MRSEGNYWEERLNELICEARNIKVGYAQKWLDEVKSYNRICIFGAGEHGYCWYQILKKYGIKVDCFYDNNQNKWQREIVDGIKCFSAEDI